ncbi:MAG: peptide chain release factor N(5)-glutamine methyltransferase [bacterium]|nr:peptide chain release factor N(5)-glutamine methyltransferase [bacterium]
MKIILEEELKKGSEYLLRAGIKQYRLEAEILLSHILKISRQKLYIQNEMEIMDRDYAGWMSLLAERKTLKPIAYILGRKEFMSMDFLVDENVLIPRPETEFIIEKILEIIKDKKIFPWWIVDLGTGSGNITVSLLNSLTESLVFAIDISDNALTVAKKNAEKYKVENRAVFFQGDWFAPLEEKHLEEKMDFIVSNPPYLTKGEMNSLPPDVEYEPKIALDGGDEGMNFYEGIINNSLRFLKKGGYLFLEIGIRQKKNIIDIIKRSEGYSDVEVIKDYAGYDRIIFTKKRI